MTDPVPKFPRDRLSFRQRPRLPDLPRWAPSWPFLICVILPTLLAAFYFLLIASPRYVSEARFIVRQAGQAQPDALGLTLQGVGLSATQTDAFAVHDYMRSRDAVAELDRSLDLSRLLGPPGADIFSRWPRPWESRSREGLHKGYQRFVTVGYDATTGISILRVEAYRPEDARRLAEALLTGGEGLVNRLNARSVADAVSQAETSRDEARERLSEAQRRLVAFRNRQRFIDPSMVAAEGAGLLGSHLDYLAVQALARDLRGPGAARARRTAALADGRAANPFESALRAICLEVDGLDVVPQVTIRDPHLLGRPDLTDVRLKVVLEADSFEWHGDRAALHRDANRYNALVAAGWLVLRFSWEEVMFHPERVRAVLEAVVAARTEQLCAGCRAA